MIFEREVEVLRAGLSEYVQCFIASLLDYLHRLLGGHMHDVQRRAGHLREHDRAVSRLGLGFPGAGEAVVLRIGLALSECLLHQDINRDAVLSMHHDGRTVIRRGLHGPQDLTVVAVEDTWIRHEEFEAGDAFVDEFVHGFEGVVVHAADDLVEAVVDRALAVGLCMPCGEGILHALTKLLHREVDDGGGASPGCRSSASFEGIRGERAAEGQLHVGVHIHATGDDVLAAGVEDLIGRGFEVGAQRRISGSENGNDGLTVDENIGLNHAR